MELRKPMSNQIEFANQLKLNMTVKTKKRHTTIVMGCNLIPFPQLPLIEIPEGIHGQISYVSNFSGEFHVKWTELEVETIEDFDSQIFEDLEFELDENKS